MAKHTTIKKSLRPNSGIRSLVVNGLGAMRKQDRALIDSDISTQFEDSIDIDEAARPGNEQENRWDYLLGISNGSRLIAVEPHTAGEGEISVVVAKRIFSKKFLEDHLIDGKGVEKWLWVASGKVGFLSIEKAKLRLDQNGIEFVGRLVRRSSIQQVSVNSARVGSVGGKKKARSR